MAERQQDERMPGPALGSSRQLRELWLVLARFEWNSLAIVPADTEGSTEELSRSLAAVGKNLSYVPVSAVTVKLLGPGSAMALAALAQHVRNRQERLGNRTGIIEFRDDRQEPKGEEMDSYSSPAGRLILGVPSVVVEPAGLAVAHAVDAVVLGVELGRTPMRELKKSIELIGRDRIVGCCLL
ncbi:hypothetical protein AKJ08_0234 [Vulgatibacter incomptus]|uniref:Uncharacterized protein n=1 Tax=Vulgatibacter incomptus TaxID=1391653 RepID=A0A0K1P8L6_9BACT|nr:hypothetical protein AKJ08_0234 [Vulgatibacter incomptus]